MEIEHVNIIKNSKREGNVHFKERALIEQISQSRQRGIEFKLPSMFYFSALKGHKRGRAGSDLGT